MILLLEYVESNPRDRRAPATLTAACASPSLQEDRAERDARTAVWGVERLAAKDTKDGLGDATTGLVSRILATVRSSG